MKPGVRFEESVSLFVLENEGVFFNEGRQELYVYNTQATYVWCCLEEGMPQADVVRAYADAFGVTSRQADLHVADLLAQWQGMGYIGGADLSSSTPIEWTTAVARLLVNRTLRDEFRKSPRKTVRSLRVRPPDRTAIAMLDPEELEAQAEFLAWKLSPDRRTPAHPARQTRGPLLHEVAGALLPRSGSSFRRRYYRVRGRSVTVQFGSRELEADIHPAIAHMETRRPTAVDVRLSVLGIPSGYALVDDLATIRWCPRQDQVTPLVKAAFWQAAHAKRDYFLEIHAGVVSNGERCLLLPAAPGSGKTTLTAALIASGWRYFSDEVALLEQPLLELRPVPLSLTVKRGAIAPLSRWYPQLGELRLHQREDDETVCYLPPPRQFLPADLERKQPVGWVVLPRYCPGAETVLRPVSRPEALRRLTEECLTIPDSLTKAGVAGFVDWMRGLACFEMDVSSLDSAIDQINNLCQ